MGQVIKGESTQGFIDGIVIEEEKVSLMGWSKEVWGYLVSTKLYIICGGFS